MQNQNEEMTIDFIPLNGMGKIQLTDGTVRDIFVYGYFKFYRWFFIVHQDMEDLELLCISEASTGALLKGNENYRTVEDALYYAEAFLQKKKYYLATKIGDVLVRVNRTITANNIGLRTLAIDTALWL